jgi:hypothetical protein
MHNSSNTNRASGVPGGNHHRESICAAWSAASRWGFVGFINDAERRDRGFIDEAERCGGGSSHRHVARDPTTEADRSDTGGREWHGPTRAILESRAGASIRRLPAGGTTARAGINRRRKGGLN